MMMLGRGFSEERGLSLAWARAVEGREAWLVRQEEEEEEEEGRACHRYNFSPFKDFKEFVSSFKEWVILGREKQIYLVVH